MKAVKTAAFLYLALIFFISILMIFSLQYTNSILPVNLLHCGNINFSFSGNPEAIHIYPRELNIGMIGINNTEGMLIIRDRSRMKLNPMDHMNITFNDHVQNVHVTKADDIKVYTQPGALTNVSITVSRESDFLYSMTFKYHNESCPHNFVQGECKNYLKYAKKSNGQYLLNSSFAPGPDKNFFVKNDPERDFKIVISGDGMTMVKNGQNTSDITRIEYKGQIDVLTDGRLKIIMPVSSVSHASGEKVKFERSEGTLDVRHQEYKSNRADNITVISNSTHEQLRFINGNNNLTGNHIYVRLLNGNIIAYGQVDELEFRELTFDTPLVVLLKEGKLALATGLLSSFFTLAIGRWISRFKKK